LFGVGQRQDYRKGTADAQLAFHLDAATRDLMVPDRFYQFDFLD
jgi:hypothetical protein